MTTSSEKNLALNRPTAQSSILVDGVSGRGVDGNSNQDWNGRTCTHTTDEANPWWRVELASEFYVGKVKIYGRDILGYRLNGLQILVGNYQSGNGEGNEM